MVERMPGRGTPRLPSVATWARSGLSIPISPMQPRPTSSCESKGPALFVDTENRDGLQARCALEGPAIQRPGPLPARIAGSDRDRAPPPRSRRGEDDRRTRGPASRRHPLPDVPISRGERSGSCQRPKSWRRPATLPLAAISRVSESELLDLIQTDGGRRIDQDAPAPRGREPVDRHLRSVRIEPL